MRSLNQSGACSKQHIKYRPVLFCLWLTAIVQIIYSNSSLFAKQQLRNSTPDEDETVRPNRTLIDETVRRLSTAPSGHSQQQARLTTIIQERVATFDGDNQVVANTNKLDSTAFFGGFILMAEAGKKKKKEKSEVVVISVQNSPAKGGGMYPIFIPSCGGHGGGGGGGGYGRRKRRSIEAYV